MRYQAIAEYYDAEYEQADMLQEDVPFFLHHLPKRPQNVLELAVGTGRAAIPVAQAGHRVVGVDNARDMLAIARRKRDGVGIPEDRLELVRGDILRLNLKERFDWVSIFFNTFLIFTTPKQQDAALQVVRKHLKPGGHFWIDLFQPNLSILASEVSKGLDPTLFYVPSLDRTVLKTTDVHRDPAAQLQHVTFHYRWFDSHGVEQYAKTDFDLTFIFPREFQLLLERNGFDVLRLYGNYDGSKIDADSPRMIAVCQKG